MRCRVIFSATVNFQSAENFFDYAKNIVKKTRDGRRHANFYLFGEDILGALERKEEAIISHDDSISLAERLQKFLCAGEFIIFSIYEHFRGQPLNAVYLVGRDMRHFDFKRKPCIGEEDIFGRHLEAGWDKLSRSHPKSPIAIQAGRIKIQNLYLAVCSDVRMLPDIRLPENSLFLVPAYNLHPQMLSYMVTNIRGKGQIFINDPRAGVVYNLPFGGPFKRMDPQLVGKVIEWALGKKALVKELAPNVVEFKKRDCLSFEFELNP